MAGPEPDPDDELPGDPSSWNWRAGWHGLNVGMHVGSRVGGGVAFTGSLVLFLVAYCVDSRNYGGWACCVFGVLIPMPLFFGALGGAVAGLIAGLVRGLTGGPAWGAVAGLVAGSLVAVSGAALWQAYFGHAPRATWLVPAGTLLAFVVAGPMAGLVDPHGVWRAGYREGERAAPFQLLRLFGIDYRPREKPAAGRWKPPRLPGHEQGIQKGDDGVSETPPSEPPSPPEG